MSGTKNTRGLVVDYNLLAGKGRASNNRQNGVCKEDLKVDIIIDDKLVSASKGKPSNKAADKPNRVLNHDRNIFSDLMVDNNNSKSEEFKMAAMECEEVDPEILLN